MIRIDLYWSVIMVGQYTNADTITKLTGQTIPGPDPIKLFSASIEATLKFQPIREATTGDMTSLIGEHFGLASIEAEKSFIGLGPGWA